LRNTNGTFVSFDVPGSVSTYAFAINSAGQIAGAYYVANNAARGFLRNADGTIVLIAPTATYFDANPTAMNSAGLVVGYYDVVTVAQGSGTVQITSDTNDGFLRLTDGAFVSVEGPGPNSEGTVATSINSAGHIVGWYRNSTGIHSFLLQLDQCVPSGSCRED
jgi:hypothetical protein